MKRKEKHKSSIYAYLDRQGVLVSGTDAEIKAAKKEYWKQYKNEWRKRQRSSTKQYVICLTRSQAAQVGRSAYEHNRSMTRFIRDALFAYLNKRYLPLDPVALSAIRQLLILNYDALQKLLIEGLPYDAGKYVLKQMEKLEAKILFELYNPKELNDAKNRNS